MEAEFEKLLEYLDYLIKCLAFKYNPDYTIIWKESQRWDKQVYKSKPPDKIIHGVEIRYIQRDLPIPTFEQFKNNEYHWTMLKFKK